MCVGPAPPQPALHPLYPSIGTSTAALNTRAPSTVYRFSASRRSLRWSSAGADRTAGHRRQGGHAMPCSLVQAHGGEGPVVVVHVVRRVAGVVELHAPPVREDYGGVEDLCTSGGATGGVGEGDIGMWAQRRQHAAQHEGRARVGRDRWKSLSMHMPCPKTCHVTLGHSLAPIQGRCGHGHARTCSRPGHAPLRSAVQGIRGACGPPPVR